MVGVEGYRDAFEACGRRQGIKDTLIKFIHAVQGANQPRIEILLGDGQVVNHP